MALSSFFVRYISLNNKLNKFNKIRCSSSIVHLKAHVISFQQLLFLYQPMVSHCWTQVSFHFFWYPVNLSICAMVSIKKRIKTILFYKDPFLIHNFQSIYIHYQNSASLSLSVQSTSPIYILPHKIWFTSILFTASVNKVVFAITSSRFIVGKLIGTSTIIITGCIRIAPVAHIRCNSRRCLSPAVIRFVINNISYSFISAFVTYNVWAFMRRRMAINFYTTFFTIPTWYSKFFVKK